MVGNFYSSHICNFLFNISNEHNFLNFFLNKNSFKMRPFSYEMLSLLVQLSVFSIPNFRNECVKVSRRIIHLSGYAAQLQNVSYAQCSRSSSSTWGESLSTCFVYICWRSLEWRFEFDIWVIARCTVFL